MLNTEFLLTALIVVLIPGTGVIYTISTGLFNGWRASIGAALGCTAGIIPHLLASILGLSLILHSSALLFQGIKFVGTLYLLYLAWMMWRESGTLQLNADSPQQTLWQVAVKGVWLNLLNPKLTIFFFAFLPLFLSPNATSPVVEMLMLSGVFMIMTFAVFVMYGLLAGGVRQYVVNSPRVTRWMQRSFALAFAALGLKLALTER